MGLKHNTVAQMYSFWQKEDEFVMDCMSTLRQYVNRFPQDENPSQESLISTFLKGLKNNLFHAHLYARNVQLSKNVPYTPWTMMIVLRFQACLM